MKLKIPLFIFCSVVTFALRAQQKWYWVGGLGSASTTFQTPSNWNSKIGGGSGGTVHSGAVNNANSIVAGDTLIIDGNNIGFGVSSGTDTIRIPIFTQNTLARIHIINGANVVFHKSTATGTNTLTLAPTSALGSTDGKDFYIDPRSSLTIRHNGLGTGAVVISFNNAARAYIEGTLAITGNTTNRVAVGSAATNAANIFAPAITFAPGSTCRTFVTGQSAFAAGNTAPVSAHAVLFQGGSSFYYDGGYSPEANSTTLPFIDFAPGSNYYFTTTNASQTGIFFNTRTYGNVIIGDGVKSVAVNATGGGAVIDTLIIKQGSSFMMNGSTPLGINGDIVADGDFIPALSNPKTNAVVFSGNGKVQKIRGAGTVTIPNFTVAAAAKVSLAKATNKTILTAASVRVLGKLDFADNILTDNTGNAADIATFTANVAPAIPDLSATAIVKGNYQVAVTAGTATTAMIGYIVTGIGVAANTVITGVPDANTINLSQPLGTNATGPVALSLSVKGTTLETANANGFDTTLGSVIVKGAKTFAQGTSYIIDAPTTVPFGMSTIPQGSLIGKSLTINATGQVVTNATMTVTDSLVLSSGILSIRTTDSIIIANGGALRGKNFGATTYMVTNVNKTTGAQGVFSYKGLAANIIIPVGSAANYLPVTLRPVNASDFSIAVFEGVTNNSKPSGTAYTTQLDTMVNAVWNVNRTAGTGSCDVTLGWTAALEGNTFKTLAFSKIGVSAYDAGTTAWLTPDGTGFANKTARTTASNFSSFVVTKFAAGIRQIAFDPLPVKTYGDASFDPGAMTNEPTVPISYTSGNTQVAVIVANKIQVVGAGTAIITASQAGATSRTQTFTVNKAVLTITAKDTTVKPASSMTGFSVIYSGFKNGDNENALTVKPVVTTNATPASPVGVYVLTPGSAQAANYSFVYITGTLNVSKDQQAITFNVIPHTYGEADFDPGAVASSSLQVVYTSSVPAVATIVNNKVHIISNGVTTITASQPGNISYNAAADVQRQLVINKATLTITPNNATKAQGDQNPPLSVSYNGFVYGENEAVLTRMPVVSTLATLTSLPGTFPIIANEATAVNYNIVFAPGQLLITPSANNVHTVDAFANSRNSLHVRITVNTYSQARILLYNANGQLVAQRSVTLNHAMGVNDFDLQLGYVTPGVYLVNVIGEGWVERKTVTILR